MNLFGIGLPEVILIAVIAVVVLGPERMPAAAVQLARAIKFLRGYATDATAQLRSELGDLTKEYEEVRKELQEFRESVRKDITSVTREMDKVLSEAQPITGPGGEPPPEQPPTASPAAEPP